MITEEGKAGRTFGEKWSAILVPSPTASNTLRQVYRSLGLSSALNNEVDALRLMLRHVAEESVSGARIWGRMPTSPNWLATRSRRVVSARTLTNMKRSRQIVNG